MLEATLRRWAPPNCDLSVQVSSAVPAGSSLGTSASIVVALVTALQALEGAQLAPAALARAAHDVETVDLRRQSGVQDQVAAAFGGANLLRVAPYPHFEVHPLEVPDDVLEGLSERLVTVYLGAHDSSDVHLAVIEQLKHDKALGEEVLGALRRAAKTASDALEAGDLASYGGAMVAATQAQALLHPMIVNPVARDLIEVAASHGALGWKVNGAGGPGGSLSLVSADDADKLLAALEAVGPVRALPLRFCKRGAEVVDAG